MFWWTRFVSLPSRSSGPGEVDVVEKGATLGSAVTASVVSALSSVAAASTTLSAMVSGLAEMSTSIPAVETDTALPMTTGIVSSEKMAEATSVPLPSVDDDANLSLQPEGIDPQTGGLADSTHDEL